MRIYDVAGVPAEKGKNLMSRIGKKPIPVPSGVSVSIDNQHVRVKGPLGELHLDIPEPITAAQEDNQLLVKRVSDDRKQRALQGLVRALLANNITGVSKGFSKNLVIEGVGFRAKVKGKHLTMNLGYSHPVEYTVPDGVELTVEKNKISLHGADKQVVGQVAAEIRSFRKVEPYKGKGIRYEGEVVQRKVGKVGT